MNPQTFSSEGVEGYIPFTGPLQYVIQGFASGIRSGMSYSGAFNLKQLREKVQFVQITNSGFKESNVHGITKMEWKLWLFVSVEFILSIKLALSFWFHTHFFVNLLSNQYFITNIGSWLSYIISWKLNNKFNKKIKKNNEKIKITKILINKIKTLWFQFNDP